jgi:hypothetical protein
VRRGQFNLVEVILPLGVTSKTLTLLVWGFKAVRARTSSPIQACLCSLPWRLKVNRRFDGPIYLFGCEEDFRLRSHRPS